MPSPSITSYLYGMRFGGNILEPHVLKRSTKRRFKVLFSPACRLIGVRCRALLGARLVRVENANSKKHNNPWRRQGWKIIPLYIKLHPSIYFARTIKYCHAVGKQSPGDEADCRRFQENNLATYGLNLKLDSKITNTFLNLYWRIKIIDYCTFLRSQIFKNNVLISSYNNNFEVFFV